MHSTNKNKKITITTTITITIIGDINWIRTIRTIRHSSSNLYNTINININNNIISNTPPKCNSIKCTNKLLQWNILGNCSIRKVDNSHHNSHKIKVMNSRVE